MNMSLLRRLSLSAMCLVYVGAGVNHFWHPEFYLPLMPPWIPAHELMIKLSGVCEISLGILLLPGRTRKLSAYAIILMLVVFMNVHVFMFMERDALFKDVPAWIIVARLPLQFILMYWAYCVSHVRNSTRILT